MFAIVAIERRQDIILFMLVKLLSLHLEDMKYNELERLLKREGCFLVGNRDHPIWYSPITNKSFATGHHGSEEVNPKTLHKIMKAAGLK